MSTYIPKWNIVLPGEVLEHQDPSLHYLEENGVRFVFEHVIGVPLDEATFRFDKLGKSLLKKVSRFDPEEVVALHLKLGGPDNPRDLARAYNRAADKLKGRMRREIQKSKELDENFGKIWDEIVKGTKRVAAWGGNTIAWVAKKIWEGIWAFFRRVYGWTTTHPLGKIFLFIVFGSMGISGMHIILGELVTGGLALSTTTANTILVGGIVTLLYHILKQGAVIIGSFRNMKSFRDFVNPAKYIGIKKRDVYNWENIYGL